ncbi:MAG: hypothetical protein ACK5P7_03410 [Bdellovibrio sp.]|jgi:hypothetical protein
MKLNLALGLVCLLNGSWVFAKAKEETPAAAAPAADKPWVEVQNRISALATKNKQLDEKLKALIRTKMAGANAERMKELDKEIQTIYDQWKQSSEDLNRENSIFRYRFPERAAHKQNRIYNTSDVPSLQKVEELVGMEGKLQRNMRRMRSQYGQPAKRSVTSPEAIVEEKKKNGEDEKNIRDSDSPILRK